jgi:hypothetical protein
MMLTLIPCLSMLANLKFPTLSNFMTFCMNSPVTASLRFPVVRSFMTNSQKIVVRKSHEKSHLQSKGENEITLKFILKNQDVNILTGLNWLSIFSSDGSLCTW